jgi:outer membrane protein TolC
MVLHVGRDLSRAADAGLTIEEAVRLARTRNERSRIADERLSAAEARVDRARAFFFPDISIAGDYVLNEDGRRGTGGTAVNGSRTERSVTASVGLSLFNARAFPLYRQAKLERESAALSAEEEKRLLMFETADAFLQTLSLEQVSAAAERRLSFARRTVEDIRTRFEAKLVGLNDLTRAELELATAERELSRAKGEADLTRLQLGYLIDFKIEGSLVNPVSLLSPEAQGAPGGLVAEARRRRLDLAAGEKRAEALDAFAEEPLRRIIPSLDLTGQYRATADEVVDQDRGDWFVGLNLTWLLYDGGERRGDYAERKALARVADLETIALARRIEREVQSALVALESERATIRQASVAADIARKNAEEVTILNRQGLASALEIADANLRFFEAEVALARARYGLAISFLGLRTAVGLQPLAEEGVR